MTRRQGSGRAGVVALAVVVLLLPLTAACATTQDRRPTARTAPAFDSWVYQLQNYRDNRLGALARAPHDLAVIDLARDARTGYFRRGEIRALKRSGKKVLSYFEIGSLENFRPEWRLVRREAPDLILNRWDEWPEEYFVKYWDPRWWRLVVRPRLDRSLRTGYNGAYLDTPLAYEEIPLPLTDGRSRKQLGRAMVDLIMRMNRYAAKRRPGYWIVPQNSPELRLFRGYTAAIDGIGMEELFYRATDRACTPSWCEENLRHTRRLRAAGRFVLAVDYAVEPRNVRRVCTRYDQERFTGYVTVVELDRIKPPCP